MQFAPVYSLLYSLDLCLDSSNTFCLDVDDLDCLIIALLSSIRRRRLSLHSSSHSSAAVFVFDSRSFIVGSNEATTASLTLPALVSPATAATAGYNAPAEIMPDVKKNSRRVPGMGMSNDSTD